MCWVFVSVICDFCVASSPVTNLNGIDLLSKLRKEDCYEKPVFLKQVFKHICGDLIV